MRSPFAKVLAALAVAVACVLTVVQLWLIPSYNRTPVGRPVESPVAKTIFDVVDDALRALPAGAMAFNTPPPTNIDAQPPKVELRVGLKQLPSELASSITVPGNVQEHVVQISDRMEADLIGDDATTLTITPLTKAVQAVSSQAPTIWMWSVKPLKAGVHPVHLTLYALAKIDGEVTPIKARVFEGAIDVTITPGQRAKHFVTDHWQWLWTALLVPVGRWWWRRRDKPKAGGHGDEAV